MEAALREALTAEDAERADECQPKPLPLTVKGGWWRVTGHDT